MNKKRIVWICVIAVCVIFLAAWLDDHKIAPSQVE